jgi:predicted NUDIX family NTP pyrophosphohydrolase
MTNTNRGGCGEVFIGSSAVVDDRLVHIGGRDVARRRRGALQCVDGSEDDDEDFVSALIRPKRYVGWNLAMDWAGPRLLLGCVAGLLRPGESR